MASVVYSLTMEDGSATPAWITMNNATIQYGGGATSANAGNYSFKLTANVVSSNATTNQVFALTLYDCRVKNMIENPSVISIE